MTSMRGRCAIYKDEENPIRQFIISNEYENGRRIVYHKYTGLRCGAYKKALKSHKKLWEEVMDEMAELGNCFVCEKPVFEWCESRDWCNSCKDQNIWRCEYCDEIQHNKKYRTDQRGDAWCKECKRKDKQKRAEVIADWNAGGWLKAYELRQKQLASKSP
jgi:hypothetical protein